MKRSHLLSGAASALIYLLTVILGGWLWPEYSHTRQAISELTATGAPDRLLLNILFSVALLLAIRFAWVGLALVQRSGIRLLRVGMMILLTISILSLLWAFFPMDPRGAASTSVGMIHLLLAGVISPLTIIVPWVLGRGFKQVSGFLDYSIYCNATTAIILVTGLVAAASAQQVSPYMGVYARLTIGAYQQWLAFTALILYSRWERFSRAGSLVPHCSNGILNKGIL